ncbi:AAA family ATPase, partial [Actinacidiphila glaucinigra]|uniref:AAA family ATPase n=1 Tax=Actinacidiphila glaucinigra TaxID=235986 RepID=UPI0035D99FD1
MKYGQPYVGGARGPLVGRADDVRRITALLEPGTGQALVISGEAGVGKTAALDAVAAAMAAAGTRVLRAAGAEFEADISYAGLNHLLFSLRGALGGLDEIHREALTVALGLARGAPPDRLLVCNATLILLQEAALSGPLLLVVDDFPWLDRASRAVLGFVARRLGGSTISILGAARTYVGGSEGAGLMEYELPPLTDEAADALILGRFPDLTRPVRSRLSSAARGNPLALLELPAALRSTQRTAQEELPAVLPLGKRLHDLFVRRVSRLPAPSLRLLLLATLEGRGDLGVVLAAAGRQDGTMDLDALAPAERDDLIDIDHFNGRLIFRHPLIRSGVVAASTSADRRSAHQALAASLPRHPERQAWHLAEASVTPDEQVAGPRGQAAPRNMGGGGARGAREARSRPPPRGGARPPPAPRPRPPSPRAAGGGGCPAHPPPRLHDPARAAAGHLQGGS